VGGPLGRRKWAYPQDREVVCGEIFRRGHGLSQQVCTFFATVFRTRHCLGSPQSAPANSCLTTNPSTLQRLNTPTRARRVRARRAADIAEGEGHHPDFHLTSYRNVRVVVYTHAILGSLLPPLSPFRICGPLSWQQRSTPSQLNSKP